MARKLIVSKFKFFYFEVVRACLFVCCNGMCKPGLSDTKSNFEWAFQLDTRGFNATLSHWILSVSAVNLR